jgi:hypothetical protein
MLLDDALAELLDSNANTAAFVSCLPGKLAYFHDEEPGNRFILWRAS